MKITVGVDISEVLEASRQGRAAMRRVPDLMKRTLDAAARKEQREHDYNNRTGNLEASTFASEVMQVGDTTTVDLGARENYASFVNARGLMTIDDVAAEAAVQLEYFFEGDADAIARI